MLRAPCAQGSLGSRSSKAASSAGKAAPTPPGAISIFTRSGSSADYSSNANGNNPTLVYPVKK
jgi:hypothetical protein